MRAIEIPREAIWPFMGLDSSSPEALRSPRFSPDCLNVTVFEGVIAKRTGYRTLGFLDRANDEWSELSAPYDLGDEVWWDGDDWKSLAGDNSEEPSDESSKWERLDRQDLKGTVMALFEMGDHLVAVTTTAIYRLRSARTTWVEITGDGTWSGDLDDRVEWVVASDLDGSWTIVTNGKDTPRVWDGDSDKNFETWVAHDSWADDVTYGTGDRVSHKGSVWKSLQEGNLNKEPGGEPLWWEKAVGLEGPFEGAWTCRTLTEHCGRLLLGNVTATDYSSRHVMFSQVGKFGKWWETGAGAIFFSRALGGIQRLMTMGDRVGVFADDSVDVMVLVGGDVIYATDHVIDGTRLVSGAAIVNLGPWALFMGERNFYLFDGTRMVRPVGDRIAKGYREELDEGLRERAWAFHDPAHQRVYWGVPTLDQDGQWQERVYLLAYDVWEIENFSWSPLSFDDQPSCMGFYRRHQTLSWEDLGPDVTWEDVEGTWDDYSVRAQSPVKLIGSQGKVLVHDGFFGTDDGQAVESYWTSMDFSSPNYLSQMMRWVEVELEMRGFSDEVTVELSGDRGLTWTEVWKSDLGLNWQRLRLPVDVRSRTVRVRVTGSFQMRWLKLWAIEGEAR